MAYSAPPARTEISDTYPNPSNAVARAGFGKLWDYVTGLLGSTGSPTAAKAALLVPVDTSYTNLLFNGDMRISQRDVYTAPVTPTTGAAYYTVDRFCFVVTQSSKLTVQQNAGSVTPPVGFTKYLGVTSSSAYPVISSDIFVLQQRIEGFNIADLGWGAVGASTVTLSFWVRSSLTGTFGGSLNNGGGTRSYPFSYTISAANTWEQKTITIIGDTTGTWAVDNSIGINVTWSLGVGSTSTAAAGSWQAGAYFNATGATSVVGTSGATFYITGVQLEKGTAATGFAYRPYGTELALCQRYYQIATAGYNGSAISGTANGTMGQFIVPVRAVPTVTWVSNVAAINFPTTAASFYLSSTMQNFWPYKIANGTGQDSRYHDNYTISAEL